MRYDGKKIDGPPSETDSLVARGMSEATQELARVFNTMVAKKPADRYHNMTDVIVALDVYPDDLVSEPSATDDFLNPPCFCVI